MINDSSIIETIAKRDRLILIGGLVAVVVLSWVYILAGAGMGMTAFEMTTITQNAPAMVMQPAVWTPTFALFMFLMWWVMMIAMMIPSASPMILLFAAINRNQRVKGTPFVSTSVFALGYIIVWGGFSLLATALQWGLERVGLMSAMMISTSGLFGGLVLILAGVYQLTPLKHACLRHCRSPIQFVTHHWRKGPVGALRMGSEHGVFCLGCCWSLMALLFIGGVMKLLWIVGLAIFVLLEKTIPAGYQLGSLGGIGLVVGGVWMRIIAL
jgi:predicted metal-binding membrane protein